MQSPKKYQILKAEEPSFSIANFDFLMQYSQAFVDSILFVLVAEGALKSNGGQTNQHKDKGGLTRFGLSQKYNPEIDVTKITLESAVAHYHKKYYLLPHIDKLPHYIQPAVFSAYVNAGVDESIKFLQLSSGAAADGLIGNQTVRHVLGRNAHTLLADFLSRRGADYSLTAANDRSQSGYLRGWLRRTYLQQAYTHAIIDDLIELAAMQNEEHF